MKQQELETLMTESAQDAVGTSHEIFQIELDYSADSIALVDDLLLAFVAQYHDQALEDEAVFTLCNIYGAYIGVSCGLWSVASGVTTLPMNQPLS